MVRDDTDPRSDGPVVPAPVPVAAGRPGRGRTVLVLMLTHLVLGGAGAVAFMGMQSYRDDARLAQQNQQGLQQQFDGLQKQWAAYRQDVDRDARQTAAVLTRLDEHLVQLQKQLDGAPRVGPAVTTPTGSSTRYAGPVLPDRVVDRIVSRLSMFDTLDQHVEAIRQYHRFIKSLPADGG